MPWWPAVAADRVDRRPSPPDMTYAGILAGLVWDSSADDKELLYIAVSIVTPGTDC